MDKKHIFPIHDKLVQRSERASFLNQKAGIFWLTGLSGSGKSTIASFVERQLFSEGFFIQVLDGDNVRNGLCQDLSFSLEDRKENIRRIAELSKLYVESGVICINAFVSPTTESRMLAKSIIGEQDFHEVWISTSLEACEKRDTKGLYKKARAGEISGFTGIDSPYEQPTKPALKIDTENQSLEVSASILLNYMKTQVSL